MPRLRILDDGRNRWTKTTAVLTASSAAVGLPAAATQSPDRSYVWRSAVGTTVQTLDLDAGGLVAASSVAVANARLFSGGVIEVSHRGDAGSPGAETVLATITSLDRDTRVAAAFWASQSHRHWRIKFTNPGAVSSYVELGYVHLGTYFEAAVNPTVPTDTPRTDPSVTTRSVDGQRSVAQRAKFYAGAWLMQQIPEAELDEYRSLFDANGVAVPFFQVLDVALPWTATLAFLAGGLGVAHHELAGRYSLVLPWEEVR